MTQEVVILMATVFSACVSWVDSVFTAVGGTGFLVAGLLITFVTSLFLMPLRGGSVAIGSHITDFASSEMYSGRHSSGKRTVSNPSYKGKFLSKNSTSRLVRRGSHSRYYAGGSGKRGL